MKEKSPTEVVIVHLPNNRWQMLNTKTNARSADAEYSQSIFWRVNSRLAFFGLTAHHGAPAVVECRVVGSYKPQEIHTEEHKV